MNPSTIQLLLLVLAATDALQATTSKTVSVSMWDSRVAGNATSRIESLNLATATFKGTPVPKHDAFAMPCIAGMLILALIPVFGLKWQSATFGIPAPQSEDSLQKIAKSAGRAHGSLDFDTEGHDVLCGSDFCFNFKVPEIPASQPDLKQVIRARRTSKSKAIQPPSPKREQAAQDTAPCIKPKAARKSSTKRVRFCAVHTRELVWTPRYTCEHLVSQGWSCEIGQEYSHSMDHAEALRRAAKKLDKDLYCRYGHHPCTGPKKECMHCTTHCVGSTEAPGAAMEAQQ